MEKERGGGYKEKCYFCGILIFISDNQESESP
jgi:hypothetical protein